MWDIFIINNEKQKFEALLTIKQNFNNSKKYLMSSNFLDIKLLLTNLLRSRSSEFKLTFSLGNSKELKVSVNKVCFIEAKGELSVLHLDGHNGKSLQIAMSIGQCEELLENLAFIRVHRSFLVNCSFIERVHVNSEAKIRLATQQIIPVSRRKKEYVLKFLEEVGITDLLKEGCSD